MTSVRVVDIPNHPVPNYLCYVSESYGTHPGNSRTIAHTCFFFTVLDVFPFPTKLGHTFFLTLNHIPFPVALLAPLNNHCHTNHCKYMTSTFCAAKSESARTDTNHSHRNVAATPTQSPYQERYQPCRR
jgi:hypothetical protein